MLKRRMPARFPLYAKILSWFFLNLLGDIAHELCSPLARLRMALGILEERPQDPSGHYLQVASLKAEEIA